MVLSFVTGVLIYFRLQNEKHMHLKTSSFCVVKRILLSTERKNRQRIYLTINQNGAR